MLNIGDKVKTNEALAPAMTGTIVGTGLVYPQAFPLPAPLPAVPVYLVYLDKDIVNPAGGWVNILPIAMDRVNKMEE